MKLRPPSCKYNTRLQNTSTFIPWQQQEKFWCQACLQEQRRDANNVVTSVHVEGFPVSSEKNTSASLVTSLEILLVYVTRRNKFLPSQGNLRSYMLQVGAVYACAQSICGHPEDLSSSDDCFCLQVKIQFTQSDCKKIPTPSQLITNLTHRLKPHETRNQYLRARLNTCHRCEYNMPAGVYKLVFTDPDLKKLALSTLEIGTYTTGTVKMVGSCVYYLVHPDTINITWSNIFCCYTWWKCLVIMYYNTCTWIDATMYKIRLFATKS